MKIELFKFLDRSAGTLRSYNEILEQIASKTSDYLKELLYHDDNFINITYRIKSEKSFKEKIIKNNFYLEYADVESMIMNFSDLIGIRIECRFIKDEEKLFNLIKNTFNIEVGKGYYKNALDSPISMKLSDKQPQIQMNGFEIYKIDCKYQYGKNSFNFELQIKSMVNVFWGEIDHKIIYKNYNYMIDETFFKDIMSTIKDSLYMIDRQLLILFDHVANLDAGTTVSANEQINHLLSKIIHDVYSQKIKNELGFIFNFKNATDIIVEFLQLSAAKERELSYGENFVKLINRINEVQNSDMSLQDNIVFDNSISSGDYFTQSVLDVIKRISSKDFTWNMIVKIICQMQEADCNRSMMDFVNFIRAKYSVEFIRIFESFNLVSENENILESYILKIVYNNFKRNHSLNYLANGALKDIEKTFKLIKRENKTFDLEDLKIRFKYGLERIN
ncbi:MAG: (p)ppGpp synthetase [Peptoniphilus sp.]|nr:(p)ppGpp synthetase [Peptoniphilus sp.]